MTTSIMKRAGLGLFLALAAAPAWGLSVSLTAPASGTVFQAGATVALSATATPTNQNRPISKVEFFRGGTTLIGTDTTSPYSFNWTGVPAGSYSLTAKATDSSGATATSAAVTIRVNAAPTASITAPANGAVFAPPASFTLSATAADTDGTISKVEFFDGATLLGTVTASPYNLALTNVASGTHSYTARATDNDGAATTSSAVSVIVNTPPTVSITAPANNAVFAAPVSITIMATASDADGTIAKVEFFDGATLVGTATAVPYSVTPANVAAGAHSYTAKATDNLGAATTSAAVSVIVDTPPTVSITAPANGAVFAPSASFTVSATAADSDGTVSKVDFFDGATLVGTVTAAPYNLALTNVASGTHSYTARATDNNGVAATSSAVSVIVNTPPTVSITSPANNAFFSPPATITIAATAGDADGTVAKVEFYQGATLIGTSTAAPYSATASSLASGSYSFTAVATDDRGAATTSAAVSVIVDAPPTVSITSPAANASFNSPATITITATAADSDGTVAKVEFFQGTTLIGTVTAAPYGFTWSNVAAGSYSLTATATDNQGIATTSAAVPITVTATPVWGGEFDSADCSNVVAWAWDATRPTTPVSVDVYVESTRVATVLADIFRQDLVNRGVGDGRHGMSIPTPSQVFDGTVHVITLTQAGTQVEVRSARAVNCIAPGVPTPNYSGWLDAASCTAISGWAWDTHQASTPIDVSVYSDNVLVTTVSANQFRQDLANAGIGNGFHAYNIATPNVLKNNVAHTISVRMPNGVNVTNSPTTLTCFNAPPAVTLTAPAPITSA